MESCQIEEMAVSSRGSNEFFEGFLGVLGSSQKGVAKGFEPSCLEEAAGDVNSLANLRRRTLKDTTPEVTMEARRTNAPAAEAGGVLAGWVRPGRRWRCGTGEALSHVGPVDL